MGIEVIEGDLLTQDVDVIVNAANTHLWHGGGIAGAIRRGALGSSGDVVDDIGEKWLREQARTRPVPTGGAATTSAGHLPFKAIIHAVGPIWKDGTLEEEKLLWLAHDSAFKEASRLGVEHGIDIRVGLPAISCGIFGFPVELAAPIAMRAAQQAVEHYKNVGLVRFVILDKKLYKAFDAARP